MALGYRPEVDGLRAVAILPVVLYHAGLPPFSGGFVGVDIFFVISGYLITSIIIREKSQGHFSLLTFYQRRIRRILPALFVMLALTYPAATVLLGPEAMREFSGSFAAAVASVSNIYFFGVSGYFATAAELKPLLHTWSLSVEEQFYLFFPATLMLTWPLGRRLQIAILSSAAIGSLALAQVWIAKGYQAHAFFLLQSRFWELMIGVLVAYWLTSERGRKCSHDGQFEHLATLGLGLILICIVTYDSDTPFPGASALVSCIGAALFILFATPKTFAGRILIWRPLVFVGLISYSLYLWHYPLLAFVRVSGLGDSATWLLSACLLSGILAWLSWRHVEQPFRKSPLQSPARLFGWAAASLTTMLLLGFAGLVTDGYRNLYVAYRLDAQTRLNYEKFHTQAQHSGAPDEGCLFASEKPTPEFEARFSECSRRYGKAVLVLGDSHAANIYRALRSTGKMPFLVALSRGGCRPHKPKPDCPYHTITPFLEKFGGSISQLIFHVSGSHYILDHRGNEDSAAAFLAGNEVKFDRANVMKAAAYLEGLPTGPELVWLGPFAEARVDLTSPENFSPERLRFNSVSLSHFSALDTELKAWSSQHRGFRYISLIDALAFNTDTLVSGDCLTFADEDHFSRCGEELFGPYIADALK